MPDEYFRKEEALEKVGKIVASLVDFANVPKGTTGTVIRADPAGKSKPVSGEAFEVFDLAIQWHLPTEKPSITNGTIGDEPVMVIQTGKPLVDWFTKDEYEQFLKEVTP